MSKKRIIWGLVALLTLPFFYNAPWVSNARAEAATTVEASYPGLAAGVLRSAKIVDLEKGLLLLSDGIEIRENFTEEIFGQVTPDIQKELEKSLFFLLEQEVIQELIMRDAKTLGVSMDGPDEEIGKVYIDRITKGVSTTESEVRTFYDNNKEMVGGMPFDQVKGSIEQFLLQQKKQEFLDTHIKALGQKAHIQLNRDWVKKQAQLALNNPVDQARMSGKHLGRIWCFGLCAVRYDAAHTGKPQKKISRQTQRGIHPCEGEPDAGRPIRHSGNSGPGLL